ncbi:endonuclease/exonuclease/phosphatase family protein [Streptomyces sp. NPDC093252]|uniref:endonuclease/exonuclease/phosphatase family protein n=1 Tax=Streptomyces sp. NPDC093252 TaxID=3154980 RepID=UPI00341CCCB5
MTPTERRRTGTGTGTGAGAGAGAGAPGSAAPPEQARDGTESPGSPDTPRRRTAPYRGRWIAPHRGRWTSPHRSRRTAPHQGRSTTPRRSRWTDPRRGRRTAALGAACALALLTHPLLPDTPGNLASLAGTFLPWSALAVPPLLLYALLRRSAPAVIGALLPALAWLTLFGDTLTDRSAPGGELTVVSHNVGEDNPDPARTARALAATGAQVIAVQELAPAARDAFRAALPARYRHHTVQGGVGLWSTYAMSGAEAVDIMPWPRALRATLTTPKGPVTVYVAHLASVRVTVGAGFATARRDEAAGLLADAVRRDPSARTLLVGDFNGTTDDRALAPLVRLHGMTSAQEAAGAGFGFSWPAAFPLTRIDHLLARGLRPVSAWTLPATASDHLPVGASFAF